jgi:methionyl-tRNA formyltransferase
MNLRVLFCGTPEFALPTLRAVAGSRHPLVGVVTVPDRPQGRGRKLQPSPVKTAAQLASLPVWQPEALDDPLFLADVRSAAPDVALVVAFRILPEAFYHLPPKGAVNVHASLLPRYRGAAPIARALMAGQNKTGVTTFQIVRRVDRGGILQQREVAILDRDNAGTLSDKLARVGAELALQTLDGLAAGTLVPAPQDDTLASRAPKLTPEDRPIRWDEAARTSHNRVRALAPSPGATIRRAHNTLKVLETDYVSDQPEASPGIVIDSGGTRGIAVATGAGTLYLRTLQPEGKNPMPAADYLRGRPMAPGDRFE